jgi:uncharacterized protein
MTELLATLIETAGYLLTGAFAGLFGSMIGVGGGIFIVPVLTLAMGIGVHSAVAASLVGVAATSTSSTVGYLKRGLPLIRLGMVLELTTVAGAIAGSVLAGWLSGDAIKLFFSAMILYAAVQMWRRHPFVPAGDDSESRSATPLALGGSAAAGGVSGILGVGGGIIKVPILNLALGVPMHRSTATSNFMMGLTASTGCIAYYLRGELLFEVAAPLVLGVLLGARLGPRMAQRVSARSLQIVFVFVLLFMAFRMVWSVLS